MTNIQHIASEDLALYAMHALSAEESAAVAEHLATCAVCQQEVAELRGDLALLAFSVDQQSLPAGAADRFMSRIEASANATAPKLTPPANVVAFEAPTKRNSVWPVLIPWATAAAVTAVCISLGVENKKLSDTVNSESSLLTTLSAKAARAQQIAEVLNAPKAQRVTLTLTQHAADPSGHAIYLPDRGALLFQADNLKPLEKGKTYELWVIPADGKAPVPAGVFKPDARGYASVVLPQLPPGIAAKAFGVTIENDPGALTPTMPIVLAGG